jgi:hypothetical protein
MHGSRRQTAARFASHNLDLPAHRRCLAGKAGGRPVHGAAFVAYSRHAYTFTVPLMQPITCDVCRQLALSHDVVNYGSTVGGYQQLCGRCFNEAAASRLGLQGFEHVVFEPVRMVDGHGAEHEFQFRTRLFGPGMAIDAFELRDGSPAGYEFQVIGEPDGDPLELLGKLIGKMRRALALTHLLDTDHGPQVNDRLILRGTVDSDPDEDHRVPMVVIDGREISWDELGRMVAAFEGWQFKLEFRNRSEEV